MSLKLKHLFHSGEKPYDCHYCDQKFTAPSSRATHIKSIHEKTQQYSCPECEKTFNQKSNMIKHYKTIHLENVVIICQECRREFNQASALRRHIKIVHKKELPHICHCGKRFALAESLKKHTEAIHLKSRAHPCTYCDYAASRADMLKIHIRKIHTKEWSYKCTICEENGTEWGCILPKELRRHLQTRHPDAPDNLQIHATDRSKSDSRLHPDKRLLNSEKHVSIDEKAKKLLDNIKHPLEFSLQLEAEVRARACRAPPSVLSGATSGTHTKESQDSSFGKVILDPSSWPVSSSGTTLYKQVGGVAGGVGWQVVASSDDDASASTPVLLQRTDNQPPIRLFYDYQRH